MSLESQPEFQPGFAQQDHRSHVLSSQSGVAVCLSCRRRDVFDRLEQPAIVEPVHPFEGGMFDCFEIEPRRATMDDLCPEETVDRH